MATDAKTDKSSDETLVKLVDSSMVLDDPADDLRGRKVIDSGGDSENDHEQRRKDHDDHHQHFLEIGSRVEVACRIEGASEIYANISGGDHQVRRAGLV